jgi:hypothetical protein
VSAGNDKYHIIPLSSDLTCFIVNASTGRVIDLKDGFATDGNPIVGWEVNQVGSYNPDPSWRSAMAAVWKNYNVSFPSSFTQNQLWVLEFEEGNLEYPLNFVQLQMNKLCRIKSLATGSA